MEEQLKLFLEELKNYENGDTMMQTWQRQFRWPQTETGQPFGAFCF